MMTTMNPGFYRLAEDVLQYAATGVYAPNITLSAANYADYTYPANGWYWFDSLQAAEAFWELNGQSNARWVEFGAALAVDPAVNQWYHALFTPQTSVLHGMVNVGLGQAAQGDSRTFLAAWSSALAGGLISSDLVQHLVTMATMYGLPQAFLDGLQAGI